MRKHQRLITSHRTSTGQTAGHHHHPLTKAHSSLHTPTFTHTRVVSRPSLGVDYTFMVLNHDKFLYCRMPGSVALNSFLYDSSSTSISQNFPLFALVFKQFAENVRSVVARNAGLIGILKNLKQPEEMFAYKVNWINEHGESVTPLSLTPCHLDILQMTNKAWRCHFSSVLGPCRGGLRLHPTVTADMIQCLAFEHTLQNALLNMPMGGNMTGSDFDARNASDYDVLAFSRALAVKIRA